MRTVVNTVPTPLLVVTVVGLVVGIVLLSVWAVRRFVPATRDGFDAEVSSQMLGVVASLNLQFPFSGGLAVDSRPFTEGVLAEHFAATR